MSIHQEYHDAHTLLDELGVPREDDNGLFTLAGRIAQLLQDMSPDDIEFVTAH